MRVDIKGYKGLYSIDEYGIVESYDRVLDVVHGGKRIQEGRIIKDAANGRGYKQIFLYNKDGHRVSHSVHILVGTHFVSDEYKDNHQWNHKDGNKDNNHFSNLEYISASANMKHALHLGLLKTVNVIHFDPISGVEIGWYVSMGEASRNTNYSVGLISRMCRGKLSDNSKYVSCFKLATVKTRKEALC